MTRVDLNSATLEFVVNCIGDEAELIEKAFHESGSFQSLCHDYEVCKKAQRRWQLNQSEIADQRYGEYTVLLGELDAEIRTWLKNFGLLTDKKSEEH